MARPQRADHRELLITEATQQLVMGQEINVARACHEIGIAPSLANHYFVDKAELSRLAWLRVISAHINEDFDLVSDLGDKVDWNGIKRLIYEVFSPERSKIREAHIRGLATAFQDEDLKRLLSEAQSHTTSLWTKLLERLAENGTIQPKIDISAIAIMLSALPIGVTAVEGDITPTRRQQLADAWYQMLRGVL